MAMGQILIACEQSGVVRNAFRDEGWDAWSCDTEDTRRGGQHIVGDVRELLKEKWSAVIGFPPCQYLCASGIHRTSRGLRDPQLTEDALDFVRQLFAANARCIVIENSVGIISTRIRKPDQTIQPWQFGHPESKRTCLWLKNLPLLKPIRVLKKPACGFWKNQTSSKQNKLKGLTSSNLRSETYTNIATAMARQWTPHIKFHNKQQTTKEKNNDRDI